MESVTAAKRGHDCITLFMDLAKRRLMYAIAGRDHTTIRAFKADFEAHGGDAQAIEEAYIGMSNAFIKDFGETFPDTHLTFDRFHVMKLMGEAVDHGAPNGIQGPARIEADALVLAEEPGEPAGGLVFPQP